MQLTISIAHMLPFIIDRPVDRWPDLAEANRLLEDAQNRILAHFRVYGQPKPGGSKKAFFNKRTGRAIITDDCAKNKDWRAAVASFAVQSYGGPPVTSTVGVIVRFFQARPKSHYGSGKNSAVLKPAAPARPGTKPDATKLWRSTEDALTGILWSDDSLIVEQRVEKHYASMPGCEILMYQVG